MLFRLIAFGGLALCLHAQDTTAAPETGQSSSTDNKHAEAAQPSTRRFHVGGVVNYFPFTLMTPGTAANQVNGNTASLTSKNSSAPLGGGAELEFQLTTRFMLSLEYLYRHVGYDASDSLGDTAGTILSERTRAAYWDVPAVVRYQSNRWRLLHRPIFYEGGAAWRRVSNVRTSTMTLTDSYAICCTEIPTTPARRNLIGGVAGVGITYRDEMGVRVTPEVRYTRWLGHTFSSSPTESREDQVEVILGVTF